MGDGEGRGEGRKRGTKGGRVEKGTGREEGFSWFTYFCFACSHFAYFYQLEGEEGKWE